ncbi:MAG: S41 family peptidase [Nitrospinae bacterium]|nr:S41 family peptidase [Nitrospinota bacterium]
MEEKKSSWAVNAAKKFLKTVFYVVFAAFFFGAGLGLAAAWRTPAMAAESSYENLKVFAEVMALIQNYYVEEKSSKDLTKGAIHGLLRTLDPHSAYMDRDSYDARKQETEGQFGGLGIEITVRDNYVVIVAPIEDTPAERAGLMAGDKIIKIDGTVAKDMDIMDAVKRMRGKIGTPVKLNIYREQGDKTFDVEIVRAIVKVRSVKFGMIDNDTGYLRIVSFTAETSRDAQAALKDLKAKGMKLLVLDLRNDPGGLLKEAVEVSEQFIKEGEAIVSTRGRTSDQNSRFISRNSHADTETPVVVLINAGSASASEIVSGALKDHHRAVIVGVRSFGKGSVQTVRELSDGGGLSLTTARYYTPAGTMIHGVGIEPDVEVKLDMPPGTEQGPEPLREKDLMEHFNGTRDVRQDNLEKKKEKTAADKAKEKEKEKEPLRDPKKIFDMEKDNQLQKAVQILKDPSTYKHIKDQGGKKSA